MTLRSAGRFSAPERKRSVRVCRTTRGTTPALAQHSHVAGAHGIAGDARGPGQGADERRRASIMPKAEKAKISASSPFSASSASATFSVLSALSAFLLLWLPLVEAPPERVPARKKLSLWRPKF